MSGIRPIDLQIGQSKLLAYAQGCMHGLAVMAIFASPRLSVPIQIFLLLCVVAGIYRCWRDWHRLATDTITALQISSKDEVSIKCGEGWQPVLILGDSVVTPLLTVLQVKGSDRLHYLVLLPDQLEPDAYRRLRVWLRWRWRAQPVEGGGEAI
ncbi:protein YgfX [Chitinivorax sp. B]|uniref:protein YgfX n=1 Tax=Chitinivorax sp. B TaxID=2502235 RepID=UPI0010F64A49|nr:protein YgfX [Chitinivorax sp. B]